jgi:hypothetical protein
LPLSQATGDAVRDFLYKEVSKFVKQQISNVREKPFHVRLMPGLAEVRFSERSFSTRSGSWFQEIARIVATQFHAEVRLRFLVEGRIQAAATAHIDQITEAMDHSQPRRKPNRVEDIKEVLMVQSPGGADKSVRSDLFILRHDQSEMYFEMKTPDPNKGQCKRMKQDILLIMALRKGARVEAYAAAAYNPYGDDKQYRNNFVMQFLEIGKDMLVGRDFWTLIGDEKTYYELLEIAGVVGKDIEKLIASL